MRPLALALLVAFAACARPVTRPDPGRPAVLARAEQLVVVTTPGFDATSGTLRRYVRDGTASGWRAEGDPVAVVVGRTGLAWDDALAGVAAGEPRKREGDGKSPAGAFPVDTAFGFAPASESRWVRLSYLALDAGHECVDDAASAHYNTVVHRARVPRVDWASSERMRSIALYRLGVIVGYNAPPRTGRGSCIFLHVWDGPRSVTAGCTAMDERALRTLVTWLDPARRPAIVQLTEAAYRERTLGWGLP